MRHQKGNKKLNKPTDQRLALLKSLVKALFENEKIQTTDLRAKEASKMASKLITLAKEDTLHSRRRALQVLPNKEIITKLFSVLKDKYKDRTGGYIRITKVGIRKGDAAVISLLELVD